MFEDLFTRRGLSLDRLRVLVEVAEAGGISRAVDGDPVRQSQYSRQLKELEDFFEVELTRRQGKSLVLTPAGKRLTVLTRESFVGLGDFASDCRKRPVVFMVGAGESLIRWSLLPVVSRLHTDLANVRLKFYNQRTTDVVHGLQDLELDFGVVRKDAVPANLQSKPLGQLEYALFVPRTMRAHCEKAVLADVRGKSKRDSRKDGALSATSCGRLLQTLPLGYLTGRGDFTQRLESMAGRAGFALNIQLQCESFPSVCQAVALGGYAAVLPTIARSELTDDRVVVYSSPFFTPLTRRIHLVWNPRILRLRPVAVRLRDWLQDHIQL